jgi:hypothetical protein
MIAVVAGMIATYPVGGVVWDYGQYLLGLEQLGFDVYYLEDTGAETYDPRVGLYGPDPEYGAGFLAKSLHSLSEPLADRWHLRTVDGAAHGMAASDMVAVIADADLFLNVSGSALLRDEYMASRRKVLIDTDPGWNHFVNYPRWDAGGGWPDVHGWREHDHFFTYAAHIGRPGCVLPALEIEWSTTRPPVALDRWTALEPRPAWTTVMTWDNFRRPVEYDGVVYGTKELEFERIESLPQRSSALFEVAVGGSDPPVDRWRDLGWEVSSSEEVSRTADDYRAFIESSRGEFSVGKNLYVATKSGWFSCRSACYLAAGAPVVLQDTGYSHHIPCGEGLLSFDDLAGAIEAIETVEAEYDRHSSAARSVAEDHLDARKVIGNMLDEIGVR